jgi:hypothetical protein
LKIQGDLNWLFDSITDLGVVMDSRISFSRQIDVAVGKALVMLEFVKRLSGEFMDPYTLRTLYVLYDMHISRFERVQRKFVRYTLRGLGWTDMYDLPTYVD